MCPKLISVVPFLGFILVIFYMSSAQANIVVKMAKFKQAPTLDGKKTEWSGIQATKIQLHAITGKSTKTDKNDSVVTSASILGATYSGSVYFFIEWKDASRDVIHKPWVWNKNKKKYVKGPQREDRFAMQFEIEGNYSTNWAVGEYFKADMWHWKASRSNPLGLMHDKSTVISRTKLLRSYKATASDGGTIYILRSSDEGSKLYRTKRYSQFVKNSMPKYILETSPVGSVADIKVRGVWEKGKWCLEIQRKLNTGYPDDVVFLQGHTTKGGIAIFNQSENDVHMISDTLQFQF